MFTNLNPLAAGSLLVLGLIAGYFLRQALARRVKTSLESKAERKLEEAEAKSREIVLEAQEKAASVLSQAQKEERERKEDLRRLEERLLKKEDSIGDEKKELEREKEKQKTELEKLKVAEEETKKIQERALGELEKISGLTRAEAKEKLFREFEEANREEMAKKLVSLEREKREAIEAKSVEIITGALQRYSRSIVSDVTTTSFHLPDEEIKGKIIGKEGRNIRAFERLTGVEVIIDETPESLLLSSFDPMRRELAKMALEKLIKDGRIQPAKIEEKVEEAKQELDERVRKIGEDAAYEVGVLELPKEITYLLGRLNYRTSYGQNVLQHSVEMAHIASMIASELGLNVEVTKKGALLHDIGKAIDHEVEGTHVELGRKILKKYNIDERVIQAMEAHH
ncbi:MAG: Rnase Y domain-containing protein, partial [Patescibacteria group bacterium]